MSTRIIKTTTWSAGPGCHGGCGVLAYVKDGKVIKVSVNLNSTQIKILALLGKECENYYGMD